MKKLITTIALALIAAAGMQAATITITLDNPNQIGNAGDVLHFFGTITNNSSDTDLANAIYLNLDALNFSLSDATVNDNFFAPYYPLYLVGGESSGSINLFDITLADPSVNPFALYTGTYDLLGGMDGGDFSAQDALATVGFSVDFQDVESPEPTVAPEPATTALLGTGLVGLVWLHRRKRRTV